MYVYTKEHRPYHNVKELWTLDGRKVVSIFNDHGDPVWKLEAPFLEPSEVNYWMGVLDTFQGDEDSGWMTWESMFEQFHFTKLLSENPDATWDGLEDGYPVLVCFLEKETPSVAGVFLEKGESAVFTDFNCDQIRFPNRPPIYRGKGEIIEIVPLAAKEDEQ